MNKNFKLFRSEEKEREYFAYYDEALEQLAVFHDTRYVKTMYGDTHVIRLGSNENPKLVLLHCQGFSSIAWFNNLEQLSKHFEIFCIDSIGEPGKTKSNKTKIENSDYVNWLSEVINTLELKKPNIAGWSFGGLIAALFAFNQPEHINKLILMSPAGCIAPISNKFFIKLFPALITGKEIRINRFLKWISGYDNNDFPNTAFTLFTYGMMFFQGWSRGAKLSVFSEKDFSELKMPVLIMIGESDPIYKKTTPAKIAAKSKSSLSNIAVELIEGSHGFPILNAELVNEKIISFILGT